MRNSYFVLLALGLSGCVTVEPTLNVTGNTVETKAEAEDESPEPSQGVAVASRPILSSWRRTDGRFSVNLSGLPNLDTSPGVATGARALFVFSPAVICNTIVIFHGTESTGTLELDDSRGGSASADDRYCDPLEGIYDYAVMAGNHLRVCRGTACQYWE